MNTYTATYQDGTPARRGDVLVLTGPVGPMQETLVDFVAVAGPEPRATVPTHILVRGVEQFRVRATSAGLAIREVTR